MLSSTVQYSHHEASRENDAYPDLPVLKQARAEYAKLKWSADLLGQVPLNKTHFSQSDVPHLSSKRAN
jgi:hypothetical protein